MKKTNARWFIGSRFKQTYHANLNARLASASARSVRGKQEVLNKHTQSQLTGTSQHESRTTKRTAPARSCTNRAAASIFSKRLKVPKQEGNRRDAILRSAPCLAAAAMEGLLYRLRLLPLLAGPLSLLRTLRALVRDPRDPASPRLPPLRWRSLPSLAGLSCAARWRPRLCL